jgi:ComF family protein
VKFHRNRACLKFFLPVVESADFSWVPRDAVIVPVPMFWLSFWKRGFNQSEWLAWQIQKVSGLKIELDGLQKYKRTKPQSLSKVGARKGRLKKCMRWGGAVVPRAALLVDDVVTSGGTVAECARALEKAGVEEVFVWTLFSAKPRQLSFSLPRSSL